MAHDKDTANRRPRIAANVRRAVELHIRHGLSADLACELAGLDRETWLVCLDRPHVQKLINKERCAALAEAERMTTLLPMAALRRAVDIMSDESLPANIRLRAIGIVLQNTKGAGADAATNEAPKPAEPGYSAYTYHRPDDAGGTQH